MTERTDSAPAVRDSGCGVRSEVGRICRTWLLHLWQAASGCWRYMRRKRFPGYWGDGPSSCFCSVLKIGGLGAGDIKMLMALVPYRGALVLFQYFRF